MVAALHNDRHIRQEKEQQSVAGCNVPFVIPFFLTALVARTNCSSVVFVKALFIKALAALALMMFHGQLHAAPLMFPLGWGTTRCPPVMHRQQIKTVVLFLIQGPTLYQSSPKSRFGPHM